MKPYSGRPWMPEEEAALVRMARQGFTKVEAAEALNRTKKSIEGAAYRMGLEFAREEAPKSTRWEVPAEVVRFWEKWDSKWDTTTAHR